jgi:hypothetical protein
MIHILNLITTVFLLFIKSQFTTNAQNVLTFNQCTHGNIWSWIIALFEMFQCGCERSDRHHECAGEVSLHFQLELSALRFLYVFKDKNLKDFFAQTWRPCNWFCCTYPFVMICIIEYISHRSAKMWRNPVMHKSRSYCQRHIFQQSWRTI